MGLFGCWHNWEKWSSPTNGILEKADTGIGYFKVVQMRVCEKCGVAQTRKLPNMRSLEQLRKEL